MPTPMRALRLSDEAWGRVLAEAERRGLTASAIVREALDQCLGTGEPDGK